MFLWSSQKVCKRTAHPGAETLGKHATCICFFIYIHINLLDMFSVSHGNLCVSTKKGFYFFIYFDADLKHANKAE